MVATEDSKSVTRTTLADQVYQLLLDEILTGKIEPGSKLLTTHLASRFDTSLAPVREALGRLSEEGLVETKPFVGAVLKEPSWDDLKEIYLLRQELEVYAVRLIMSQKLSKFEPDHPVRVALDNLAKATKTRSPQAIIEADLNFHRAICMLAQSPLTLEVWTIIIKRFRGARLSFIRKHPDSVSTIVEIHRLLLDAIESGNMQNAESAFREHLTDSMESLRPL